MPRNTRDRLRGVLAFVMIAIGIAHFAMPGPFVTIVPKSLPAPFALVIISGFFEIVGGAGLLVPRVRQVAGVGLVLLYLAVFPANVNMALHPELGAGIPSWALWARLPLQGVLIAWALWAGGVPKR
jgi:uncharacterized membrane protein